MGSYSPRYDRTTGIYDVPCAICFLYGSSSNEVMLRECCQGTVCRTCLKGHFECKIEHGIVEVVCPMGDCDRMATEEEIADLVSEAVLSKYRRFCVDLANNPHMKTCPNCSRIYQHDADGAEADQNAVDTTGERTTPVDAQKKPKVTCPDCELVWCFSCQAPWHYGITCKEFCKGDKSLKIWAKNRGQPNRNAQRCPKCQIYIQKFAGCDHMTCGRWGEKNHLFFSFLVQTTCLFLSLLFIVIMCWGCSGFHLVLLPKGWVENKIKMSVLKILPDSRHSFLEQVAPKKIKIARVLEIADDFVIPQIISSHDWVTYSTVMMLFEILWRI